MASARERIAKQRVQINTSVEDTQKSIEKLIEAGEDIVIIS